MVVSTEGTDAQQALSSEPKKNKALAIVMSLLLVSLCVCVGGGCSGSEGRIRVHKINPDQQGSYL